MAMKWKDIPEMEKWKGHLYDATRTERLVAASLSILILAFGVYPMWLTNMYSKVGDRITHSVIEKIQITQKAKAETEKISLNK